MSYIATVLIYSHAEAIERHPCSSVSLSKVASGRKGLGAIEDTNVIESKETSLEHIVAALILSVDPPE